VLNNQTYVYHNNIEMEMDNTSLNLMEIELISMLDVTLNNHLDVLMVLVELDKLTVLFSLDVHKLENHSDVNQEDVQKMLLNVNNMINN
jgi:hypothetical protein